MSAITYAMADSTVSVVPETKVFDLYKGLKCERENTSYKVELLLSRIRATVSQDDLGDINLDSEEIDFNGVLEDEDDTSQAELLEDSTVAILNEELALCELPLSVKSTTETKPLRTLKRRLTSKEIFKSHVAKSEDATLKDATLEDTKSSDNKEPVSKKIRSISTTSASAVTVEAKKITADMDTKTKLELRAKRFGLPVNMNKEQASNRPKEARKERFGENVFSKRSTFTICIAVPEIIEKLEKRAERFGESVSKLMADIEKFELEAGKTQSRI